MKKTVLLLFIGLFKIVAFSQTLSFEDTRSSNPLISSFSNLNVLKFIFVDADGDSDDDILILVPNYIILCKNNGHGLFEIMPNKITIASEISTFVVEDVDSDGDMDLLVVGKERSSDLFTKIFKNDGKGNYLELFESYIVGVKSSTFAFADIDGDNDKDLLISGYSNSYIGTTKMYQNDGEGKFSEVTNSPFENVYLTSIAFADIDGDGDQDVIIAGKNSSSIYFIKQYTNDGNGGFSEVIGSPFTYLTDASIAISDEDGDNDQDVLIIGNNNGKEYSYLYRNDGAGSFTQEKTSSFIGNSGSSTFADVDGDNDQDVLISGTWGFSLYINDGIGNYSIRRNEPFQSKSYPCVGFSDTDNDGDQDLLVCGLTSFNNLKTTKLYSNDGNGFFYEFQKKDLDGIGIDAMAFSDVDGDNDKDILISGWTEESSMATYFTRLFINDGSGDFSKESISDFEVVYDSKIVFADIDGDNDEDVLISGITSPDNKSIKLYKNDGEGKFTEVLNTPFVKVFLESIAFTDVDGDDDLDLLISGTKTKNIFSPTSVISSLYINDGNGNYAIQIDSNILGICDGDIAFSDIDGDNDSDLVITGMNTSMKHFSALYKNDGSGKFQQVDSYSLKAVSPGAIALADIDGDGDQDLLLTGDPGTSILTSNARSTTFYLNKGNGVFSVDNRNNLPGLAESATMFFDADKDGDMDLLISGFNYDVNHITRFYENDGDGYLTQKQSTLFEGLNYPNIANEDIDNDGDTDIITAGINGAGNYIIKFYVNTNYCIPKSLIPVLPSLPDITSSCSVERPNPPKAQNCSGEFEGIPNVLFPINDQSVSEIIWSYVDNKGNHAEQTQKIIWSPIDASIINDNNLLKVPNNYDTYQWIDCSNYQTITGATSSTFIPKNSGSYAVVITDKSCRIISDCYNVVTTGLNNVPSNDIRLYPNPTKDYLFVSGFTNSEEFTIYSYAGCKIETGIITNNRIDLSIYEKGIYFVGLGNKYYKIIKF